MTSKIYVMKKFILTAAFICTGYFLIAQPYPEAEFSNEIYFLKKDSVSSLVRLEKNAAGMEAKTKAAGFGGYENGYVIDGERSAVRLRNGQGLSFVYATETTTHAISKAQRDSMMRANGIDPAMMPGIGTRDDPASSITLYKTESGKGKRKILLQKAGGAFSSKKLQSSPKYTFSVKPVRSGYWELIIDKPLPKGEYAFSVLNAGTNNMDGSTLVYSFGID